MLTVSSTTHSTETVAFYNTLETAALGCSNCIKEIAFNKYILYADLFAKLD